MVTDFRRLAYLSIWKKRHAEELSNKLVEIKSFRKKYCISKLQFLSMVFICIVFLLHPVLSFAFSNKVRKLRDRIT